MKTLLVPIDFSPNAETALYFAMRLARQLSCKLILLNAIETAPHEDPPSAETQAWEEAEKNKAMEQLRSASVQIDYAGGIIYECRVVSGKSVVEIIASAAKETYADFIIMGTKGERGAGDFVFGTITSGVIEDAQCPVLVIPENTKLDKAIKKITYATDFLQSDLEDLKTAATLADTWNAELNILHVYQESDIEKEPEQDVSKLGELVNIAEKEIHYKNMSFEMLSGTEVEARLIDYLKAEKTDMLMLSTRHRNYFGRLLNVSMAQNLARLTPVPLLAFHHCKEKELKA